MKEEEENKKNHIMENMSSTLEIVFHRQMIIDGKVYWKPIIILDMLEI